MDNFVFKTRNPEYSWTVIAIIWILGMSFHFFFIIPLFWSICIIIVTIFSLFVAFLFTTKVKIERKEISINKKFVWITYYTYWFKFENITMAEQEISFIDINNQAITFVDNWGWDNPDEFTLYTIDKKEIVIGGVNANDKKDFQIFKTSLEQWIIRNENIKI